VKINLFFLILLLFIGCTSKTTISTKISCPKVLFAAEHKKFFTSNTKTISVENISYRAEINNYAFNNDCSIVNDAFQAELSLLFIVKPNKIEEGNITLPFYVAILNPSDELLNMQYYQINDSFQKESVSGNYIETELIQRIKLQMPFLNDQKYSSIKVVVGFMLDKKKLEILN